MIVPENHALLPKAYFVAAPFSVGSLIDMRLCMTE